MNGNDSDHAFTRLRCMLVVFGQASVTPLPRIGPLDDPTHRQRFEARLSFRTAHDLQPVRPPVARQPFVQRVIMIPGIREDHLQPRKVAARGPEPEHVLGRSGIVHVGRRHHDGDQKTQWNPQGYGVSALVPSCRRRYPVAYRPAAVTDRLAVDRRGGGELGADRPACGAGQRAKAGHPRSFCQVPSAFQNCEVVVHRLPGREVVRQGSPGTAFTGMIEQRVDYLTQIDLTWATGLGTARASGQ